MANVPFFQRKLLTRSMHSLLNVTDNKAWVVLCKSVLPTCDKIFIKTENYIRYQNDTIYLKNYTLLIGNDEFDMWDSGILTCKEYLRMNNESSSKDKHSVELHQKPDTDPMRGVVSIVCSSLSLVAVLLTFVTYCCFPSLRTLPGKCVMSLTISLFFAQLLFSVSTLPTRIPMMCLLFSVFQHYCWLAAFAWMNVLSISICLSFS